MALELLDVTTVGLAYTCLGGFVVAFSMFSLLVKEIFYINEVVLGTAFGIILGPHVAGIFDPRSWVSDTTVITQEVTRIVLATGLFAVGVELPKSYMAKHAKSLLIMVVPTMAVGWIIVGGLLQALFPNLSFYSCLAIATCFTSTDPIICAAIVGGKYAKKHVPLNLRQILSAESAANDSLALLFLTLSLNLILIPNKGEAITQWILVGWLYQAIVGVVIGAILGFIFAGLMKFSHRRGFIDHESYVAQYLALTIFTTGIVSSIGSNDLLAAFAAGSTISWDGEFNDHTEDEAFASVIDLVLNCACFIYIGAWLPFEAFNSPELGITPWRLIVLFIGIITLRRIPAILVLYKWIPEVKTWREALFSGHFALRKLPNPQDSPQNDQEMLAACIQPIVAFIVLCSIIIHGLSIPFFSLGKNTLTLTSTLTTKPQTLDWIVRLRRAITRFSSGMFTSRVEPDHLVVHSARTLEEQSMPQPPRAFATPIDESAQKSAYLLSKE
ncbi:hypothetical protein DXG01_007243 [Tephrocybe rancida]|nr:hypothetical protein DXG01_007243 [Tephrocybe rancida]